MGRPHRLALAGYVYHVLNRDNGRAPIFHKDGDFEAFEHILGQAVEHVPGIRLLSYCLMPNHWHLLLWPEHDGGSAIFMQRVTITDVRQWPQHRGFVGLGHVYQGRYKSFPVQSDEYLWVVARYVERNAPN